METEPSAPVPDVPRMPGRGLLGIAFIAFAILLLEVALTRIFSVVMWYHFAFVVISLAMLGLAISGIILYFIPPIVRAAQGFVPWFSRLAGLTTAAALVYLAHTPFKTASAEGIFSKDVAIFYAVTLAPFLFGGLAISAALARHPKQIGTLYFSDLVGAGIGCALVVVFLNVVGAPATILIGSAAFFVGALLLRGPKATPALDTVLVLLALGAAGWAFQGQGSAGPQSQSDLKQPFEPRYQKGVADWEMRDHAVWLGWNSHSRIKVYEPPPPPAADTRPDPGPSYRVISIDGSATTGIERIQGEASKQTIEEQAGHIRTWVGATPYVLLPKQPKVLIIGPGGGRDVLAGLVNGAKITAVEVNGLIVDLMTKGPFAEFSGHVYRAPGVTAIHDEARSYVRRTSEKFDLIQATLVDTWAATASGAFTLAENALYTVEAFDDFFEHLTDDGIVHFTRWHRDPPRESLRAVVLMTEVMKRRSIPNPERHVIVGLDGQGKVDGGSAYAVLLWSKKEFTPEQIAAFEKFGAWKKEVDPRLALVAAYAPGTPSTDPIGKYLTSPDRTRFVEEYDYDIRPTTDDRPFFFNAIRLWDVVTLKAETYQNEQAVVVLVTVLTTVLGIVAAAFILPFGLTLPRIRRASGRGTGASLLYFCCLGVGFMLVEMPVLQRFGLYLGHPMYALSTILATLLTSTGIGSALAGWWAGRHPVRGARIALVLIMLAIGALVVIIPQLLAPTLGAPLLVRIGITVAVLFPLGLLMGFPMPLGIRALTQAREVLIPWAWGMNGATSVLASILGVAIGIYAGFTVAILVGAAFYCLALVTAGKLVPSAIVPAPVEQMDVAVEPAPIS